MAALVVFLFGFIGIICALNPLPHKPDECELGILICQPLMSEFTTTTKLYNYIFFETEWQLNEQCRKQEGFIKCIQQARTNCLNLKVSRMAEIMLENRLFAEKFCVDNSLRNLYLKHADCINGHTLKHLVACKMMLFGGEYPEMTDISEICRHTDGLEDCKVERLKDECGPDAADIYKRLMLLGGWDYICSYYTSENEIFENKYSTSEDRKVTPSGASSPSTNKAQAYVNSRFHHSNPTNRIPGVEITIEIIDYIGNTDSQTRFGFKDSQGGQNTDTIIKHSSEKKASKMPKSKKLSRKRENDLNNFQPLGEGKVSTKPTKRREEETNVTFTIFKIMDDGTAHNLGRGQTLHWNAEYCLLNNLSCTWIKTFGSASLFNCAVYIEPTSLSVDVDFIVVPGLLVNFYYIDETYNTTLFFHKPSDVSDSVPEKLTMQSLTNLKPCKVENIPKALHSKFKILFLTRNISLLQYKKTNSQRVKDIHRMGLEWTTEDNEKSWSNLASVEITTLIYDHLDTLMESSTETEISSDKTVDVNFLRNSNNIGKVQEQEGDPVYHLSNIDHFDRRLGDMVDASNSESNFQTEPGQFEEEVEITSSEYETMKEPSCAESNICKNYTPDSCFTQDNCEENTKSRIKPGTYIDVRNIEVIDPLKAFGAKPMESFNYKIVGKPYLPLEIDLTSELDSQETATALNRIEDLLDNLLPEVANEI